MARQGFILPKGGNMKHAQIVLQGEHIAHQEEQISAAKAIALSQEEIKQAQVIAQLQQNLLEEQKLREANIKSQMGIWLW